MGFEIDISLTFHLLIHFLFALLSGLTFGIIFKKIYLGISAGIIGGFLIDLDHVLEYFFVFGLRFNLNNFLDGLQFLTSDKIWLVFHAYEYFPLLLLIAYLLRRRFLISFFIITLAFSGLVHLVSDSYINNYPPKNYSIIYRATKNFSAPALLNSEQWSLNLKVKENFGL